MEDKGKTMLSGKNKKTEASVRTVIIKMTIKNDDHDKVRVRE